MKVPAKEAAKIIAARKGGVPMRGKFKQYGTKIHDDGQFIFEMLDGTTSDAKPLEVGSPNWKTMMEYADFIVWACNSHEELLAVLRQCLPIIEAHVEASHLTDGFRPRRNRNDDLLNRVRKAMESAEGRL